MCSCFVINRDKKRVHRLSDYRTFAVCLQSVFPDDTSSIMHLSFIPHVRRNHRPYQTTSGLRNSLILRFLLLSVLTFRQSTGIVFAEPFICLCASASDCFKHSPAFLFRFLPGKRGERIRWFQVVGSHRAKRLEQKKARSSSFLSADNIFACLSHTPAYSVHALTPQTFQQWRQSQSPGTALTQGLRCVQSYRVRYHLVQSALAGETGDPVPMPDTQYQPPV